MLSGVMAAAAVVTASPAWAASAPAPETVYSTVPATLPPNFVSQGFTATTTSEYGDLVQLGGTARRLDAVDVVLSSWACQVGSGESCLTNPGATFNHPVTLNVYAVDRTGAQAVPGALLTSKTQTFAIPYRPSADATCATPTAWRSPTTDTCANGFATTITFDDLDATYVPLRSEVIVTVAYPTSRGGTLVYGGPYDSLNVAVTTDAPSTGTDVEPNVGFLNSANADEYAPTDAGTPGTLRRSSVFAYNGSSYTPVIAVRATPLPTVAQCSAPVAPVKITDLASMGFETRAQGSQALVKDGIAIKTVAGAGDLSLAKSAGYVPVNVPLEQAGTPALGYTVTSGAAAGLNLSTYVDGAWFGNLVYEPLFDKYWSSKAVAGLPAGPNPGYQKSYGTLNDYLGAWGTGRAVIKAVGYSLGSGAVGEGVVTSLTVGCQIFTFGTPAAPSRPSSTRSRRTSPRSTATSSVAAPTPPASRTGRRPCATAPRTGTSPTASPTPTSTARG